MMQDHHPSTRTTSTLNPSAREWYPPGYVTDNSRPQDQANAACSYPVNSAAEEVFELENLPREILSTVVSCLDAPQDLCSCLLATQQLQGAVQAASVKMELTGRQRQRLSFPPQSGQLDDLVHALTSYMPAMSTCNLSMLPLEHRHVSKLSRSLHNLQHLDLSGCKKLQPSMAQQLLQHLASKQLQSINLQRCFQLTDACLTAVLDYACGTASSSKALQCIALSHLNLAAWPAASGNADCSQGRSNNHHASEEDTTGSPSPRNPDEDNSSSSSSSDLSESDANNNHSSSTGVVLGSGNGSMALQWRGLADGFLLKLPKQLGLPLISSASGSALRVVVLNNCSLLSVEGLVSLAAACPQLEYLFLGGSTLKTPSQSAAASPHAWDQAPGGGGAYVPRSVAAAAAGSDAVAAPCSTPELPLALQELSELLQLPATLPWDLLSSCCEASSCSMAGCGQGHCTCPCSCCGSARRSGVAASDGATLERASKRLHRMEPSAAAITAARSHALGLAYVAALLPGLKVIEVTFMAPGVAGWLNVCLDRLQQLRQQQQGGGLFTANSSPSSEDLQRSCSSSSSSTASRGSDSSSSCCSVATGTGRPKVWQFSCVAAVADAMATLSEARGLYSKVISSGGASTGDPGGAQGSVLSPECLSMAVRCAANCSSRGRSTPLHMAADTGCACHIKALLSAGAAVAARDASGASPLFVACESGQGAAAAVLLEAGADAVMGNTAGETPLYIASLRGHLGVVELLLRHLSAADVDWTQRQLYGDAWTPLMAAAVANRVNVAVCLLRAAAMHRYGQNNTTGDSQAAPGSSWVGLGRVSGASSSSNSSSSGRAVRCGAGSSPGVTRLLAAENRYGQTVLHIAARKGCRELLQLLLLYGAGQVAGRVADAAGDTPLDIARRHGHETAVRELLQQC